jgi:transcriptional regulator with XRE-family HTH domain
MPHGRSATEPEPGRGPGPAPVPEAVQAREAVQAPEPGQAPEPVKAPEAEGGQAREAGQAADIGQAAERLAQALRVMQRASGRSLRSLARDVHVSHSSLSRYLRGEIVPGWTVVKRTCELTGGDVLEASQLWRAAAGEKSRPSAPDGAGAADRSGAAHPAGAADPSGAAHAPGAPDGPGPAAGEAPVTPAAVTAPAPAPATAGWAPDAAPATVPGSGSRRGPAATLRRWMTLRGIPPLAAAAGGVTAGLAAGVLIGLYAAGGPAHGNAADPASDLSISPTPASATGGKYCPWKYVVTDGNPDDIRVFDSPQHDSIIGRYVPDEVFYAPDPPRIVNGYLKTEQGWIGMGNWVQRYHRSSCHIGGP